MEALLLEDVFHAAEPQGLCSQAPSAGVELSRRGGSRSTISRSGSPGGSDLAEHSIRVASTPCLIWAVGKPSSAISGETGVDGGQSMMVLAAARSSRASTFTCPGDVAGSQAAAACSIALRT